MDSGTRIGRYEIRRLIGEGGMGKVYEAVLHGPGGFAKSVALKLLSERGDALVHEARLGGLLRHPNLVDVYALEQIDERWVCAMELVAGGSLAAHMPLPLRAVADVGIAVCRGLAHAHDRIGLVHLDIKPANLLVDHGVVKVADLGISMARGFGEDDTVRGSPIYMSPEHLAGYPVDVRADVWGLAVTLIELATGDPLPNPAAVPEMEDVLKRCLELDPGERFQTMTELRIALEALDVHGAGLYDALAMEPTLDRDGASATVRVVTGTSGNMSDAPDPFVGREHESAVLLSALENPGITTLRGSGGLGKTRLARRIARRWQRRTGRQAWFCDLSDAGASDVLRRVATVLSVPLRSGSTRSQEDRVGTALAGREEVVLVVDNCEHVVDAVGALLTRWRQQAPLVRFVVTSRAPLHVRGERLLAIEPLTLAESVELLRIRAASRGHDIEDTEALRDLATRLDGIPLALELAAGRLGVLGPKAVCKRLSQRLDLLRSRDKTLSPRQATLEGTLDWSWELLDGDQRAVLGQLATFAPGFTPEAAEEVAVLDGSETWVVDVLEALVDQSLLSGQGGRLAMFDTTRQWAARRNSDPEGAELRHGQYYATLGTPEALEALYRPGGVARWRALSMALDNLVLASRRAIERGDVTVAVPTVSAACRVLSMTGPSSLAIALTRAVVAMEGLDDWSRCRIETRLGQSLMSAGQLDEAGTHLDLAMGLATESQRADLLGSKASLARARGDWTVARKRYEDAIAANEAVGNLRGVGNGLANYSTLLRELGEMRAAEAAYTRALSIHREVGNRRSEGNVLGNLGIFHLDQGHYREARSYFDQALVVHLEVGNLRSHALVLANIGVLLSFLGDQEEAISYYEAALRGHRRAGDRRGMGICLCNLGECYRIQRNLDRAREVLAEARVLLVAVGDESTVASVDGTSGRIWRDVGDHDRAMTHYKAAIEIFARLGERLSQGVATGDIAALHLADGRHAEAAAAVERSEALLSGVGRGVSLAVVLCVKAEIALATGHSDTALEVLEEARGIAEKLGTEPDSDLGRAIARVHILIGEPD